MPLRDLTPEEAQKAVAAGYDPSKLKINTDSNPASTQQPAGISQASAVGSTLKANAGGILGGGAGGLAGGIAAAALAPETGGLSLLAPILGGAIGAAGGGYAGQSAQQSIEDPATYEQQQSDYEAARQQHPYTTAATDIGASALASGGMFSPTTAYKGIGGLLKGITGGGLNDEAKQVLLQSVVNPAINTGIGVATGQGLPSAGDLAQQAVGGALFAKSSALGDWAGRAFHPEAPVSDRVDGVNDSSDLLPPVTPPAPFPTSSTPSGAYPDVRTRTENIIAGLTGYGKYEPGSEVIPPVNDIQDAATKAAGAPGNIIGNKYIPMTDAAQSALHMQSLLDSGAPVTSRADSEDIGLERQRLMIEAKRQQDLQEQQAGQAEVARQGAAQQQTDLAGNALDIKNALQGNQLAGPEQRPSPRVTTESGQEIHNDYTGNIEHDNANSGDDLAERQTEAALAGQPRPKYTAKGADAIEQPLPEDVLSHIWSGHATTGSALDAIAKSQHPYAPLAKQLLTVLDPVSAKTPINVSTAVDRAHYMPATGPGEKGTINAHHSDAAKPSVIMEEMIHSMTSDKLPANLDMARNGGEYKAMLDAHIKDPNIHPAIKDLMSAYIEAVEKTPGMKDRMWGLDGRPGIAGNPDRVEELAKPSNKNIAYGMGSIHEFIAHAFKNKDFQNHLDGIKTTDGRTIWQKIVDSVRNLFGLDTKSGTMLDRVLRSSAEVMKINRGEQSARMKANSSLRDRYDAAQEKMQKAEPFSKEFNEAWKESESIKNENKGYVPGTEPKEPVNSSSQVPYGHWIAPDGTMHPVYNEYGHVNTAEEISKKLNPPPPDKPWLDTGNRGGAAVTELYNKGYARGIYDRSTRRYEIEYSGERNAKQSKAIKDYAIEHDIDARGYPARGLGRTEDIHTSEYNRRPQYAPLKTGGKNVDETRAVSHVKFNIVKPELDKFAEEAGPKGKPIVEAASKFIQDKDGLFGKYAEPIFRLTDKMKPADITAVHNILMRSRIDQKDYRSQLGNGAQTKLYDTVRAALKQKQLDQIASGQKVTDVNGAGKPFQRDAKVDPYYYPMQLSSKVMDTMVNNRHSAEAQRYKNILTKFWSDRGKTPEQINEALNTLQISGNKGSTNQAKFAANRIAEGLGLPPELTIPDFNKSMNRYWNRVSTDRSYYNNFESKPEVMKALDPNDAQSMYHEFKGIDEQIKGEPYDKNETQIHSWARLATANMLGPLTNLHIALSSAFNPLQYMKLSEVPDVYGHMFGNWSKNQQEAYNNGYAKRDFNTVKDMFNADNTFTQKIQALSSAVGKLNGREWTNTASKTIAQGLASKIVALRLADARNGDAYSVNMLKKIDPSYTPQKTYSPEEQSQLASTLAGFIHGAHDFRTLPEWMNKESIVKPFFSLMSWSVAQTNQWMKHVWEPAKQGNLQPLLLSTLGAVFGGYAIQQLRQAITDKKSAIPSLQEITSSKPGAEGNIPLLAYNFMQMASFTGFAGIASSLAKDGFDMAYKNIPQGSSFPLDEVIGSSVHTMTEAISAWMQRPDAPNFLQIFPRAVADTMKENSQFSRIAMNWAADKGVASENAEYQYNTSNKTQDLRRYKMASGQPYDQQTEPENNPYLNIEAKNFKRTNDIQEAAKQVPGLMQLAASRSAGNPEIYKQQLEGYKHNSYDTMPSPEQTPMQFQQYLDYVRRTQGEGAASSLVQDYMRRNMLNQAKSSLIP